MHRLLMMENCITLVGASRDGEMLGYCSAD